MPHWAYIEAWQKLNRTEEVAEFEKTSTFLLKPLPPHQEQHQHQDGQRTTGFQGKGWPQGPPT